MFVRNDAKVRAHALARVAVATRNARGSLGSRAARDADVQVLPLQVPPQLQDEAQSAQDALDQGVPSLSRQGDGACLGDARDEEGAEGCER